MFPEPRIGIEEWKFFGLCLSPKERPGINSAGGRLYFPGLWFPPQSKAKGPQRKGTALKVPIESIQIGDRHRKDMGDIHSLASSIADLGLLQPIGITSENMLIFGERRLRACRDILGLVEIDARVIDMPHIVVGENAENEVRKEFTPSERVAIARAIEEELGSRRGVNQHNKEGRQKIDNPRTDDFAAKKAGFGNRETYRQAKHVVDHAEPEVTEAMDNKVVSISHARKIADRPPEEQREIIRTGKTPREMEAEAELSRRKRTGGLHPLVKVERVINCLTDIRDCGLTASEFRQMARGDNMVKTTRVALPVMSFLRELMEVENDQKRTG